MLGFTLDTTISVGNIISGIAVAVALFIGRKIYTALTTFTSGVALTAEVVDEHTDILSPLMQDRKRLPYVGERRRFVRRDE